MLKENRRLLIYCSIAFVLQVLALIWKPFVFIELAFLVVLIASDKIENKICYLFFMLPFYNVFRYSAGYTLYNNFLDSLKSLYLSVVLVLTFCAVMFVKYIIDLKQGNKKLNWKVLILWVIAYILLIVPINKFNFAVLSSLLAITSLFASVYLIVQYKEHFNLKKILDIWFIGVILSVVLHFFKGVLPHLNSYLNWFDNRFFGIHADPNYYAFELMTILIGYTYLFLKKQVDYEYIVIMSIVIGLGILSLSKSFLISFAFYAGICLIYLLKYLAGKIKSKKKRHILITLTIAIMIICLILVVALIGLRLWSENKKAFVTEGLNFIQIINVLTTGRLGIWISYIKLFINSFSNVIFGYGALNGYPYKAIHNSVIQFIFFGGLIETIFLIAIGVHEIKKNKNPMYIYWLTLVLCLFACSIDLLFSYRTYLILTIIILMFSKNDQQGKDEIK